MQHSIIHAKGIFMKLGSTVKLLYTGTLEDGTVFGYAKADEPMEFQTGMDLTIPGFEKEVLLMSQGEKKTFTVGQYEAYGEYLDDLIEIVPTQNVPLKNVEIGNRIWMTDDNGEKFPVTGLDINSDDPTFDLNHPLAGKDLTFEVEILEVLEPEDGWQPPQKHDPLEYGSQLGF